MGRLRSTSNAPPAFDYGRAKHVAEKSGAGVAFKTRDLTMGLSTDLPLRIDENGGARTEFSLKEGESRVFIFKELRGNVCEAPPSEKEAQEVFEATVGFWRKWLSSCTYRGRWREQVLSIRACVEASDLRAYRCDHCRPDH